MNGHSNGVSNRDLSNNYGKIESAADMIYQSQLHFESDLFASASDAIGNGANPLDLF